MWSIWYSFLFWSNAVCGKSVIDSALAESGWSLLWCGSADLSKGRLSKLPHGTSGSVCAFESVPVRLLIGVLPHGIYRYYHILIFKCIRKLGSVFIFGLSLFSVRISRQHFCWGRGEGGLGFLFWFGFWLAFVGDFSFFKSLIKEKRKKDERAVEAQIAVPTGSCMRVF